MSPHICGVEDKVARTTDHRPKTFAPIRGGMELSSDYRYRNSLWCSWSEGKSLTWIMFNPSTADISTDDPGCIAPDDTIHKVVGYSQRHADGAFGSLRVVNLFAWRSPCRRCTMLQSDPIGHSNEAVGEAINGSDGVVVAWGGLRGWTRDLNTKAIAREEVVLEMLEGRPRLHLIKVDNGRFPGHPQRKSDQLILQDWD